MKHRHRFLTMVAALLVMLMMLPGTVLTGRAVEPDKSHSLSVVYPEPGVTFRLYRVAELGADGGLVMTEEFKNYAVELNPEDTGAWAAAATTLAAYSAADRLEAKTAESTQAGSAVFSELEAGLYLICWDRHGDAEGYTYTPQPFFAALPGTQPDGTSTKDVVANAKYQREKLPQETTLRVHKAWDDNGAESSRPKEIEVQLLKNGEVYETVVLNAENSWSAQWDHLDSAATWQVLERNVPTGYTVQVTQEGTTYLITNSTKPVTPPNTPSNPPRLPQTGMLWWPVSILAVLGTLLVICGIRVKKKSHNRK